MDITGKAGAIHDSNTVKAGNRWNTLPGLK